MRAFYTFQDLLAISRLSESTARRRLKESRNGVGQFPKPIDGFKRKLLFHPDEVQRWATGQHQSAPVTKVESETQRQRRHKMAMSALEKKGVKTTKTK
jgi:hypothetical protein